MDWTKVRRNTGPYPTIDLIVAFQQHIGKDSMLSIHQQTTAETYLARIEAIMPIRSRQAAAVAIATAIHLAWEADV